MATLPRVPTKIATFSRRIWGTKISFVSLCNSVGLRRRWDDMDEMSQLTTAMMAVVFAAVLIVSGQLFIEYRSSKRFDTPAIAAVKVRAAQVGIPLPL